MKLLKNIALDATCKSAIVPVCIGALLVCGCSQRRNAQNSSPVGTQSGPAAGSQSGSPVEVKWDHPIMAVKSTPTLQVVVNPMLRRGSTIHDQAYDAVKQLQADYVRYVPWLPYPKLAVAELEPPTKGKTSWDFSLIDPMTEDFMSATAGHSVILNFSTIPQWMFKTPKPISYPSDPDQVDWNYGQGTELRDPSMKELGGYYARLVSWYTQGGFTDELGVFHKSNYHYTIPYWEVLNEVNGEKNHKMTPEQYTERYDAIVEAILKVAPDMKFMGIALGGSNDPQMFEYFLDHSHHHAGIPLNFISYHFYASPSLDQTLDDWQYTFFDQADGFLSRVKYIEAIRKRLSPETKTDTDELGVILPDDNRTGETSEQINKRIPPKYWNLAGGLYAYIYIELAKQGIDVIGESQLVGYPTQFPSVTMIDWNTGKPNARYWVLKLIKDNFSPGDEMLETDCRDRSITVQAFKNGNRKKLLIVNKRDRVSSVSLPADAVGGQVESVDPSTGEDTWKPASLQNATLKMQPFAVVVVSFK